MRPSGSSQLRHCKAVRAAPSFDPVLMIRFVCCLVLTCLVAACAPRKAVVIEEAPATVKPKQTGAGSRPAGEETPAIPRQVVQRNGMQLPDLTRKLPDKKDMTPTAAPTADNGSTVIASPPTGAKPVKE